MAIKGNEGFRYNPGTGTVTLALNFPLYWKTPGRYKWRASSWNLEGDKREVLTLAGGAVEELHGRIRFEGQVIEVLDMLEAGADGVPLDYYPDLGLGGKYTAELVEPTAREIRMMRDQSSRGALGEYEVAIRLRRTDGGNFDNLFS